MCLAAGSISDCVSRPCFANASRQYLTHTFIESVEHRRAGLQDGGIFVHPLRLAVSRSTHRRLHRDVHGQLQYYTVQ